MSLTLTQKASPTDLDGPRADEQAEAAEEPQNETEEAADAADLEPDFLSSVTVLEHETQNGVVKVYIVGTAHVSEQSVADVHKVILKVKPAAVMVELCRSRRQMLGADFDWKAMTQDNVLKNAVQAIRQGRDLGSVLPVLLSCMMLKVGAHLQVMPGAEFRAAALCAQDIGARIVLGDRPVEVTLRRLWHALSLWEKVRLVCELIRGTLSPHLVTAKEVEELKDHDFFTEFLREFGEAYPSIMVPLLHERDLYMAAMLRTCCRSVAPPSAVVAVVGLAHVQGITKAWDKEEIDLAALLRIPAKKQRSRLLFYGTVAGAAIVFAAVVKFVRR